MRKTLIAGVLAVAMTAPPAQAAAADAPRANEAAIPFVNHGGIRDWRATDDRTLYLQDAHRNWYRATLFARCFELPWAQAIGFETRGADRFDRFSSVMVRGERCHVDSLVRSEPPPRKAKRRASS